MKMQQQQTETQAQRQVALERSRKTRRLLEASKKPDPLPTQRKPTQEMAGMARQALKQAP